MNQVKQNQILLEENNLRIRLIEILNGEHEYYDVSNEVDYYDDETILEEKLKKISFKVFEGKLKIKSKNGYFAVETDEERVHAIYKKIEVTKRTIKNKKILPNLPQNEQNHASGNHENNRGNRDIMSAVKYFENVRSRVNTNEEIIRPVQKRTHKHLAPLAIENSIPKNNDYIDDYERIILMNEKYADDFMLYEAHIIENNEEFECSICMDKIPPKNGIRLRSCLHEFCKEDIRQHILHSNNLSIKCPSQENACECLLSEIEIKALISKTEFEKLEYLTLRRVPAQIESAFTCKTPNCMGFCINDQHVQWFECPICKQYNCTNCEAIHDKNQSCQDYQEEVRIRNENDTALKKSEKEIEESIKKGECMRCPNANCKALLVKIVGCDWMVCQFCKTEICWATKGPRWGPKGKGDTSGGCGCIYLVKPCHPLCKYCH